MTEQPARYRHRVEEVDAIQWTGHNADALRSFCGPDFDEIDPEDRTENPDATAAVRESEHGTWRDLEPGYWVVKRGEDFYEESPADFAKQYEPAAPPADRDAVRDRIVNALHEVRRPGLGTLTEAGAVGRMADAVMAVLPASADRAAVLNEAADAVQQHGCLCQARLRRMAAEARDNEQQDGPAIPGNPTDEDILVAVEEALEKSLLPEPGIAVLERTRAAVLNGLAPIVKQMRMSAEAHGQQAEEPEQSEPPTAEQIAREHLTTLHLIGEKLTTIEAWFWEHLADVRDAAVVRAAEPVDTQIREISNECCGAEPPASGTWGDCWCTLPPGHDDEHQCQPCTDRHGAPGWTDEPAAEARQDGAQDRG